MSLLDYIKPLLREDANVSEVEHKILEAVALTPEKVKEYIAKPENKPVFDSIAGKAITTHIEKEKAARSEWEKVKAQELFEQAKQKIELEKQKTPEMIKIEELEARLAQETNEKVMNALKGRLYEVVKTDKLPVHSVDPFLQYGDNAETELRAFAEKTSELIQESVKKQVADKFGGGDMPGGNKPVDDKPVDTTTWLESQGFTNTV